MERDAHLDLHVRREWSTAEHVRTGVSAVVEAVFADSDLGYMLSMVAAELVENALKYGGAPSDERVRVVLQGDDRDIVVEVTARGEPSPADLWRLRERIAWLHRFEDAAEAYRQSLLAAA